jgi:hypothetical protein
MALKILSWDEGTLLPKRTEVSVPATSFTAGSLLFAGADGGMTEDNAGLFYDNTNNRLGIGTNTPVATLDVGGAPEDISQAMNVTGTLTRSSSNTGGAVNMVSDTYYGEYSLPGNTVSGDILDFPLSTTRSVIIAFALQDSTSDEVRTGTLWIANSVFTPTGALVDSVGDSIDFTWLLASDADYLYLKYSSATASTKKLSVDAKVFYKEAPLFNNNIPAGDTEIVPADEIFTIVAT